MKYDKRNEQLPLLIKKKKKNTRVVARSANDLIFVIVDKSFTRQHVRGNS